MGDASCEASTEQQASLSKEGAVHVTDEAIRNPTGFCVQISLQDADGKSETHEFSRHGHLKMKH